MALIIQKYGGSSLDSIAKIKNIAQRVVDLADQGNKLVIVVSALGETTDNLLREVKEISDHPDQRELDMLLSIGERKSIALMSLAINEIRENLAISFTGSQIGLITDCNHGNAKILEIKGDRLKSALANNQIPIIAGFQGVSTAKEITTLGRGGSDTTAIALAAALNADHCQIYSNVDGFYSSDPHLYSQTQLLKELDFDSALEITNCGAKVLKETAVEYAKRLGVKISLGNSQSGYIGTIVSKESLSGDCNFLLHYDPKLRIKENCSEEELLELKNIKAFKKENNGTYIVFLSSDKADSSSLSLVGANIEQILEKEEFKKIIKTYLSSILIFYKSYLKLEFYFKSQISNKDLERINDLILKINT